MRVIWNIASNQIQTQIRERGALFTLFIMPVIMMFFIGKFATGFNPSTLTLDVLRRPDASVAGAAAMGDKFIAFLRQEGAVKAYGVDRFVVCDLAQIASQPDACKFKDIPADADAVALAKKRLEDGIANATVKLPDTFSADLAAGETVNLAVEAKTDARLAQQFSQYVQAVNTRLGGAVLAAQGIAAKTGNDAMAFQKAFEVAIAAWEKNPVVMSEKYSTVTGEAAGTGFGQSAPGIGAQFVMVTALALAQLFITGRQTWTTQRLLVMPITKTQILAGRLIGQFVLCVIQFSVMLLAGAVLGVSWGDPLGVVVVVLAYGLAVTSMGLAVSTIVKTAGQAGALPLLISLALAPLGGAWWPLDITPPAMQTIGKIVSPIAWSQSAFSQLVYYGGKLGDILPQLGVLLLFAAVFFSFGVLRFRHDE